MKSYPIGMITVYQKGALGAHVRTLISYMRCWSRAACISYGLFVLMGSFAAHAQQNDDTVRHTGAMRNVMRKGELHGTIYLDSIADRQGLYGLGPVEYLAGELMVIDGKAYKSVVLTGTTMSVKETYDVKAPFFVYAHVEKWEEYPLPDSVGTIAQIERYLDVVASSAKRPFAFKLEGMVDHAVIHIQNLPKGAKVSSPEDARVGQVKYPVNHVHAAIIGFFSTAHQGIFTHHDSHVHMHLMTKDRQQMGHIDELKLKKGEVRLYLPAR